MRDDYIEWIESGGCGCCFPHWEYDIGVQARWELQDEFAEREAEIHEMFSDN